MLVVTENGTRDKYYELEIIDEKGKRISTRTIKYQTASVTIDGQIYMYIYDDLMTPIRDSFQFINYEISSNSSNTKAMAMYALKFLYSFESIIGLSLKDFSATDIRALRDYLLGFTRTGNELVFKGLTTRKPETVNMYLGIYRQYLKFKGENNAALSSKKFIKPYGTLAIDKKDKTSPYKSNVYVQQKQEVPKYISVDEFKKLIEIVRSHKSIRDECIIRLMYETGMRLGEVLGQTNEDIRIIQHNNGYSNAVFIRNRISDKKYQLAKTVINPTSYNDYHTKSYNTENSGYQVVYITDSLYELLGEYIDLAHENARALYKERYFNSTIADSIYNQNDENFYVFINKYGSRLSNVSWNRHLRELFTEAGIPVDTKSKENNLSHRFRHGFAMFQVEYMHKDILELSHMMRHNSPTSSMKYFRPTISDQIQMKTQFVKELYDIVPELKDI